MTNHTRQADQVNEQDHTASTSRGAPEPRSGCSEAPRASRLDDRTLLGAHSGNQWSAKLYEGAGELVVWLDRGSPGPAGATEYPAGTPDPSPADQHPADSTPPDDDRAQRRARSSIRRYAVANGCSRLATLTYRDQTADRRQVRQDVAWFARRLREQRPSIAYAFVLERHRSGMLHVHVLLNEYVPKGELGRLWGRGFVDVRKIRAGGGRESARLAARYVAKYVVKDAVAGPGEHRYDVRQGRQPIVARLTGGDPDELRAMVADSLGVEYRYEWFSDADPGWRGPPVIFATW